MVNGAFMVKRALPFNKRVRKTMEICAALRRDVATPTRGSCKSLQDYAGFKSELTLSRYRWCQSLLAPRGSGSHRATPKGYIRA
jgi:hypothetical protein